MRPEAPRERLSEKYVDVSLGWRPLLLCVLVAGVFGLGFRLYFSPQRLKRWVTTAVTEQKKRSESPFAFAFDSAELRLANGAIPQFAVVLKGVKVAPAPECRPEPSLSIAELRLPFRLRSLIVGKFAVGTISAADMSVDIDGLKARCDQAPEATARVGKVVSVPAQAEERPPKPWWNESRIREIAAVVDGVDFSRVDLQFENRTKHVFLESFSAEIEGDDSVELETELRIPPETVYGEQLPPFVIEGVVSSLRADVSVEARVAEGDIEVGAVLTPGPNRTLMIDADFGIQDLPLSTVMPLLRKFQIAGDRFQPRFLWLDCRAKIAGAFHKLFETSPLHLEDCRIEGDGAKVTLARATRSPQGAWDPFTVDIDTLDIGKLLKTVEAEGPHGIASQFGRLTGKLSVNNPQDASFMGAIQGAKLTFSSQNVRATQDVARADLSLRLSGETFTGEINHVTLRNGEMTGRLFAQLDRGLKNGFVDGRLDSFVLDPAVQNLLVRGEIGPMSGKSRAEIRGGELASMKTELEIAVTKGREFRFDRASLSIATLPPEAAAIALQFSKLRLNQTSRFFTSLKPIFLIHEFETDWIFADDARADLKISEKDGVRWTNARAKFENNQIQITSDGQMSRERSLRGTITVDFPRVKNLKWNLAGDSGTPRLIESSKSLEDLNARVEVDAATLGLVKSR